MVFNTAAARRMGCFTSVIMGAVFLAGCQTDNTMQENESGTQEHNEQEGADNSPEDPMEENESGTAEEGIHMNDVTTEDWDVEVLAENLEIPWSLNIHEETVYMTDRHGRILEIENGETEQTDLQTSSPVAHEGEGGLLGFKLADDFADSGEAYVYYTFEGENGSLMNRVAKVKKENDDGWAETDIFIDDIPGAQIHNGGRLAIGPDGMLYATTGDADDPDLSQDEDNLAGSILRMTAEGDIPEDNPFEDSYVFSYGHRNPQGLAWDENEAFYSSEHGPVGHDEINLIEPGNNYGWPVIEGGESNEGMEEPLIHSGEDTWAPSGVTFRGNDLLVTGLRGESLYYFDEDNQEMTKVFEGEGRLRDVKYKDGAIYLITNNTDGRGLPEENDDRLLKLTLITD
ncbi:PQQ-dependent sugar dehydrogenase [Salipaludibacillus aurantiacus]|uniref:Glucose/arabinose dehydrogenase, beta-propeller fold n=1 Tax=Salipaludibacillus aurantiacus TaxID=1601833 RepID=A0A1H9WJD8_9BACI|nr:PQQ-dependent sugar dehydrogenase [Salipaludibacillus aurantiacus]SES33941.1 Glucose/arabinose dehydrogenase, beta-propeller fold [Salipaludibacillus aurantiacus]